jgi:peroxiredoxin
MLRGGPGEDQGRFGRGLAVALVLAPFAVATLLPGCGKTTAPPTAPSPLLAHPTPDFRRPALDGSVIETSAWGGHVALVDFFSEQCAPCKRALPSVEALHRSMPDLVVLGISEDDEADGALRMVQTHNLTFPIVHDAGHVLAGRFRVTDLPATFVVDAHGLVRWLGATEDEDGMRAVVNAAR